MSPARRALALATLLCFAPGAAWIAVPAPAFAKPTNAKAIEHGKRGNKLFGEGDFEGAKEAFEKAYEIESDDIFVYGIAQALNQLGDCKGAIRKYKVVKDSAEVPPEVRRMAEEAMLACAEKVAEDGGGDGPAGVVTDDTVDDAPLEDDEVADDVDDEPIASSEPKKPKTRRWYADPLGDVLGILGLGGIGAGIGLFVVAQNESKKGAPSYQAFGEQNERIRNYQIAAGVSLGVGVALLGGAIARWVVVERKAKQNGRNAQVGVLFDGRATGLSLSGRF